MKDAAFLIFNKRGLVRMTKGKRSPSWGPRQRPALNAGEYAVLVSVSIPDKVFAPTPTPEATVTVPESMVIEPPVEVSVEMPPEESDA